MKKPKAPRLPAKKWMLLAVIEDRPRSGEEYLTEQDIRDLALTNDLIEGMKFSKIKLQAMPPRAKSSQKIPEMPQIPVDRPKKTLAHGEKTLDNPPPQTGKI